ncbi:uncharacterized protein LOC131676910 [Topomyia yanbarensis]|uniref:uncharacterized protein LOC131676910 n=1 Tax=Topomyia yanbarensis TaxID=2498891 RepID=UPI00273C9CAE|nr:uncharacterized protein LOC131676910 [Topomyia yanbarensis]
MVNSSVKRKMKMTSGTIRHRVQVVFVVVFVLCFCLDCVKGGCLSYGHSCWGGHGKRSGPPGRTIVARTIPAPPISTPDLLWPNIEQRNPPGSKGSAYEIQSAAYYQPMNRLFRLPPATMMDLLDSDVTGSSSSASGENDVESEKSNADDAESVVEVGSPKIPDLNDIREESLRMRQQRRKTAALLKTVAGPESGDSDEESFGRLFMNTGGGRESNNNNLLKLLGSKPHRKYGRSS